MKTNSQTAEQFIDGLDHPLKAEIASLRHLILGIDPSISEEVKWNAPSFRTSEHFATMNLRGKNGLLLILHLGAKKRSLPAGAIDDPGGILEWLGPVRASVSFASEDDIAVKKPALTNIVRQWLQYV